MGVEAERRGKGNVSCKVAGWAARGMGKGVGGEGRPGSQARGQGGEATAPAKTEKEVREEE